MLIGALTWFFKQKTSSYDLKHDKHFESIARLTKDQAATAQQIDDHERVDDERLSRIEGMFRELRSNFVDVLKALNGRRQ